MTVPGLTLPQPLPCQHDVTVTESPARMPTIESLIAAVTPVSPETPGARVVARFQAEPDLLAIPVVEGERLAGLVERDALLMRMATAPDRQRLEAAPVRELMDAEPAVLEAGMRVGALGAMLNNGHGALRRSLVVTRQGRYLGVCTGLCLLRAQSGLGGGADHRPPEPDAAVQARIRQDAAQDKCRFVTLMSHELRTPLNGVLAVADLLRRQPLTDTGHAHVQTIMESSESLLRALASAVDLARAEAGELELSPSAAGLRGLMDEVQARWAPQASQDNVSLMVSYEGDTELAAEVDAARLRQVFDTLIGHALKYARNGVVEAGLKASLDGGDVRLECRVRDDGPGVDAEARAVFGPGRAVVEGAVEAGPVDLGLSMCRLLVERMGGVVRAQDNQGRGATFSFSITAPRARLETQADSNVADLSEFDLVSSPHVLIVDDNATNRVVAQALCEMFGCTSETAEDGQEALEAVQQRPFDLILMDIKMPRMDGVQATTAIRALDSPAGVTPIIALTANADPDDARAYLACGMAAVVEKPIKPERLRNAINAALSADEAAEAGKGDGRAAGASSSGARRVAG